MVTRRKVGAREAPTKHEMNIYLLNIPFAALGIAFTFVPLIARTRRAPHDHPSDSVFTSISAFLASHPGEEMQGSPPANSVSEGAGQMSRRESTLNT